jgi:hypothetical protein
MWYEIFKIFFFLGLTKEDPSLGYQIQARVGLVFFLFAPVLAMA